MKLIHFNFPKWHEKWFIGREIETEKQTNRQSVYTQKKRKSEEENVERSTVIYSLCFMVPNPQWYNLENYKATASFAISVNSLFVFLSLFKFLMVIDVFVVFVDGIVN
jgi:hypothetical protein